MKKYLPLLRIAVCSFLFFIIQSNVLFAQCTNADFENGTLSGWTGTWGFGTFCITANIPNPYLNNGLNQGPNNGGPFPASQKNQFIMTAGNDANLAQWGYNLPVVWPGSGAYSALLGQTTANGEGESMSYSFLVTANNCNFTYHYAVVIGQGTALSHIGAATQPYFNIKMVDGSNNPITCADYQVDGLSAASIGGFTTIPGSVTGNDNLLYKPWSSVAIPLNAYIGQTVKITFTTRACSPFCGGSHYCYAYIDAECGPLQIVTPSAVLCGSHTLTLTAPTGAATYQWVGPGIVGASNTQAVVVNQPGQYTVNMTTFGNTPCPFSLDTTITINAANPVSNFSASGFCAGSPTSFTDLSTPSGSITNWNWDFNNDGIVDATGPNPTYTFATGGVYPVKLSITYPPCTVDTTISVTIVASPTSTFTANSPVCSGVNSTITYTGNAPGNATYSWNFDGGTVVSGTGQGPCQVNWATGGTKNVTLTVTNGTCTSVLTTVPVVVNAVPVVSVSPDVVICTGGNTTLTAVGGTTYTWAPGTGLNTTSRASVTATPANTITYSVTGTTSGCSDSASVTVTVAPNPTSTFTAVSPVCAGVNSTITYTGNAPSNAIYTWDFAGGTIASGTGQGPYQVNWPSGTGNPNITLTVTVGTCISTVTTVPVIVNPTPVVSASADVAICTGGNTTLSANGASSYVWAPATGLSSTTTSPVTATPANTITYSVTGTTAGCSDSASVTVTVNPIPTSTFTLVSPICQGTNTPVVYTGNAPGNATYTWDFTSATVVSGSGQGPYVINWPLGTGTPQVTLTVTLNNCTSPATTIPVTVNPSPVVTLSPDVAICTGGNTTLVAAGANTYAWSPANGLNTTSGATVIATPASTTTYIVTGTSAGCDDTASVTVTVNPVPTATFTVVSPVCTNQNSAIVYTGNATGGATFVWDFSGSNATGSGAGPYTVNWTTSGTKTIADTVSQNGCSSTGSMQVTVNDVPVSAAGPDVSFCSGDSAAIGTAATAGYNYSWSPLLGLSDATISNPMADLANTSNAAIITNHIVTTSIGNCTSSDTVTVTVYPVPVAGFVDPTGQCLGGNNFAYTAGGSFLPNATFAWNFGLNASPSTSTSQNQNVSFSAVGNYPVSLTITEGGCVSNTFTASTDVYPSPVLSFPSDPLTGCENFVVCFTNNSTGNGLTYQWSFGDGGSSTQLSPCHTFVAPGVYSVSLSIASVNGCTADTTITDMITVLADPKAIFSASNTVFHFPETTLNLSNQSENAFNYFWTFGKAGNSTVVNPSVTFTDSGTYDIKLYAYNQFGCVDSTDLPVIVYPPTNYFIPNIFTPNGDGNNDFFYIEAQSGVRVIEFQVFNRIGEKVHDGLYPWDGTYQGKPAPEGVYVYIFEIGQAGSDIARHKKGSVTLLR